jgi:hypothetical protein
MTIECKNLLQQLELYYFNSWIVDDIGKLPYRISEIYRGLTS